MENQGIGNVENVENIDALKQENSDLKEKIAKLEQLVFIDPVTELPNRRFYDKELPLQLGEVQRGNKSLAVVFLDLDFFKTTNDTRGHDGGDQVLKEISLALQRELRKTDSLSRWAGDEFVILVPLNANFKGDISTVLNRYLKAARTVNRGVLGKEFVPQTISIGCALLKAGEAYDPESIFKSADRALYDTKDKGRDGYTVKDL